MASATKPPLRVVITPVSPLQQNCTLLWCTNSGKGAFIDPGADLDKLLRVADRHDVTIEKILVTHGHIDHCGLAGVLAGRLGVPIEGPHIADRFWIEQNPLLGPTYGITGATAFTPGRWLADGDRVTVGELVLDVRHTPGHTPGHVIFHHAATRLAMVGDVLFQGSIGRTDFPQGSFDDLVHSITTRLWPLGDDTSFIPGHGPVSTFGHERRSNPFVGDAVLQETGRGTGRR